MEQNWIGTVSVRGLLGSGDHDIPLREDVTLLHALNGCGKTTLMKLIRAAISADLRTLRQILFTELTIRFTNGNVLIVRKDIAKRLGIDAELAELYRGMEDITPEQWHSQAQTDHSARVIAIEEAERRLEQAVREQYCTVTCELARGRRETLVCDPSDPDRDREIESAISACTGGMKVRFLGAGRLYDADDDGRDLADSAVVYADMIRDRAPSEGTYENVLLLRSLINETFGMPNQKMGLSYDRRVFFMGANGARILPQFISAGEKNLFIILTELIFNCGNETLLILDEPEISMHISWQMELIDVILRLAERNGFQAIIPTHSPNVINDHWDRTIGLGEDADDE